VLLSILLFVDAIFTTNAYFKTWSFVKHRIQIAGCYDTRNKYYSLQHSWGHKVA
jgi:hypothetical protein